MNNAKQISIALRWVPPAAIRGNSRAHWRKRAAEVRIARQIGQQKGNLLLANNNKLSGEIGLRLEVFHKSIIDLDNLLIGYKPIIDGFVDSGLIDDDRNIKKMSIKLNKCKESMSVIIIYPYNS